MKAQSQALARQYARAFVEVAASEGTLEAATRELGDLAGVVESTPALQQALTNPALGGDQKRLLARAVFGGRTSTLVMRLLELLASRGRAGLVAGVAHEAANLADARRGIVTAHAVSAVALDASQQSALLGALRTLAGREVRLETSVAPDTLGGIRIMMDGRVYDGTVRQRLSALRDQIAGRAPHAA